MTFKQRMTALSIGPRFTLKFSFKKQLSHNKIICYSYIRINYLLCLSYYQGKYLHYASCSAKKYCVNWRQLNALHSVVVWINNQNCAKISNAVCRSSFFELQPSKYVGGPTNKYCLESQQYTKWFYLKMFWEYLGRIILWAYKLAPTFSLSVKEQH